MKRYGAGIATLALALFLALQLFAPQGTLADSKDKKDRDYTELKGAARLSEVQGATLRNRNDEELGKIEDLVFKDGNIRYVIVSSGGVMGIGDRLIPVPWEAVEIRESRDSDNKDADVGNVANNFYVDMQRDRFVRAPSFANDNWPSFMRSNLDDTIYQYFQVERD